MPNDKYRRVFDRGVGNFFVPEYTLEQCKARVENAAETDQEKHRILNDVHSKPVLT